MSYQVTWFNYLHRTNKASLLESEYFKTIVSTSEYNILIAKDDIQFKKLFTVFSNPLILYDYQKSLPLNDRNMYEIIPGNKYQKIHFDIDVKKEDLNNFNEVEFFDSIIEGIIKYIKVDLDLSKDIMIFTSHSSYKKSYHIVIDNYCLRNNIETKQFVRLILNDFPRLMSYVDNVIYTINRQFRLLGSSKIDTHRIKVLLPEWKYKNQTIVYKNKSDDESVFINSLVSNTNNCKLLDLFEEINETKISKSEVKIDYDILTEIKKMFIKTFNCEIFFDIESYKDGLIIARRLKPSFCNICERVHQHENPYFVVNKNGDVLYSCRRNDDLVKIGIIKIDDNDDDDNSNDKNDAESEDTTVIVDKDEDINDEKLINNLIKQQIILNKIETKKREKLSKDFYIEKKRILKKLLN